MRHDIEFSITVIDARHARSVLIDNRHVITRRREAFTSDHRGPMAITQALLRTAALCFNQPIAAGTRAAPIFHPALQNSTVK